MQNECSCSELRPGELVEKLTCELCRVMFVPQEEEECLGAEDTINKYMNNTNWNW